MSKDKNKFERYLCYDHYLEQLCMTGTSLQHALTKQEPDQFYVDESYRFIKKLADHLYIYTDEKIVNVALYDLYNLFFSGTSYVYTLKDYDDEMYGASIGGTEGEKIYRVNGTCGDFFEAYKYKKALTDEYNIFYGSLDVSYKDYTRSFKFKEKGVTINTCLKNGCIYTTDITLNEENKLEYVISRTTGNNITEVILSTNEDNLSENIVKYYHTYGYYDFDNIFPEMSKNDFYQRIKK